MKSVCDVKGRGKQTSREVCIEEFLERVLRGGDFEVAGEEVGKANRRARISMKPSK